MTIVLICPKCGGGAWVMLSPENIVCYDCNIPMVDSASQQMRAADVLPCGHTQDHESMLLETGEFVCDQCGAIHR